MTRNSTKQWKNEQKTSSKFSKKRQHQKYRFENINRNKNNNNKKQYVKQNAIITTVASTTQ